MRRHARAAGFELQHLPYRSARPGVRVEVCSIANRLFGVDNAAIKKNFHVVGNTWVSLIGYQAQSYAIVPIN